MHIPPRFATTYRQQPLQAYRLPSSPLSYAPQLEWILAAQWMGYRLFHDWQELDGDQQSLIIAAYREQLLIHAVLTDAANTAH